MTTIHETKLAGLIGNEAKVTFKGSNAIRGIVLELGIVAEKRNAYHINGTEIRLQHVKLVQTVPKGSLQN